MGLLERYIKQQELHEQELPEQELYTKSTHVMESYRNSLEEKLMLSLDYHCITVPEDEIGQRPLAATQLTRAESFKFFTHFAERMYACRNKYFAHRYPELATLAADKKAEIMKPLTDGWERYDAEKSSRQEKAFQQLRLCQQQGMFKPVMPEETIFASTIIAVLFGEARNRDDSGLTFGAHYTYSSGGATDSTIRPNVSTFSTWTAEVDDANQYMIIDLRETKVALGVYTQEHHYTPADPEKMNDFVRTYKVETSVDGTDNNWKVAKTLTPRTAESSEESKVSDIFTADGSAATWSENKRQFATPVTARFIKIIPQTWQGHVSMRASGWTMPESVEDILLGTETSTIYDIETALRQEFGARTKSPNSQETE